MVAIITIPRQPGRRFKVARSINFGSRVARLQLRVQVQQARPMWRAAVVPLQKIDKVAGDGALAMDTLFLQRHNLRSASMTLHRP